MRLFLSILFAISIIHGSSAKSWPQIQRSTDFRSAKRDLANHLPDLAIPRIQKIIANSQPDQRALSELLTLLGEAQVRAGQPNQALRTLDARSLRQFSPAHLWRNYALQSLGRYRDAIAELQKIDRSSLIEPATLEISSLMAATGQPEKALEKLSPLLSSTTPSIKNAATLQTIAIDLESPPFESAKTLLPQLPQNHPTEIALKNYLQGTLFLAQNNPSSAIPTFQQILNNSKSSENIPAPIFHEANLALADSHTLNNDKKSAVKHLLSLLNNDLAQPQIEPIFRRLRIWINDSTAPLMKEQLSSWTKLITSTSSNQNHLPGSDASTASSNSNLPATPLQLNALELLATLNLKSKNPESQTTGRLQIANLLILDSPDSPRLPRALLELGLYNLEKKRLKRALHQFNALLETTASPTTKSYAKALAGKTLYALKKPDEASNAFLEAQKLARQARAEQLRFASSINAGISLLSSTNPSRLDTITSNLESPKAQSFLILERGLYLSSQNNPSARDLLNRFLTDFPSNPRAPEAQLALAENYLNSAPTDKTIATSVLQSLTFDPKTQPKLEARRILALLTLNQGISPANQFVKNLPNHQLTPRILFQTGQTLRRKGEVGTAYATFEQFIQAYPNSPLTDAARYLSAVSALATGTQNATNDAAARFRELSKKNGPLGIEASIALTSLLIDNQQQEQALLDIPTLLLKSDLKSSDRARLLTLATNAQSQLQQFDQALQTTEKTLKIPNLPPHHLNHTHFLRGQIFEKLDQPTPALQSYLQIIDTHLAPENPTPNAWKWFHKASFEGALPLLQSQKRHRAAHLLAKRISKTHSPRAKEARELASKIKKTHRILPPQKPKTTTE